MANPGARHEIVLRNILFRYIEIPAVKPEKGRRKPAPRKSRVGGGEL